MCSIKYNQGKISQNTCNEIQISLSRNLDQHCVWKGGWVEENTCISSSTYFCKGVTCMATFDILYTDQGGFEETEKCCCFVSFSGFALFVDEIWRDTLANNWLSGIFLDMAL